VISALKNALALNRERGDGLRLRLALLVGRFRRRLAWAGFSAVGGLFPVQTLRACAGLDAAALFRGLSAQDIRTVLHRGCTGPEPRLSFIITALHQPRQLDSAVQALAGLAPNGVAAMSIRSNPSGGGTS
jgi:7-keto-8-aminopelargonate synthetase-like enzyme